MIRSLLTRSFVQIGYEGSVKLFHSFCIIDKRRALGLNTWWQSVFEIDSKRASTANDRVT
jgi:hypothetical protein